MQDFILPNDNQVKQMQLEYSKVLNKSEYMLQTKEKRILPVFFVDKVQAISDNLNKVCLVITQLSEHNFYKRNIGVMQMILCVCRSNQKKLGREYNYLSKYCNQEFVGEQSLKSRLYELLKLQSKIICDTYTLSCQTKNKTFEDICREQMLVSVQLHGICI